MKIIEISFNNINNLKGENSISFVTEPLAAAGIFAITGPTGSGKSSILDVITLALFNRIPRFKGAITKSAIEGMGSVITHHTDEASASISYEIHGNKYTSSWSVKKTKAGKLKDYEMFIYDHSGQPLDLKRSEVPAYNERIIGLKYDQFIKSIILSQGQFSKFLKADKNERGQLLENLTGSSIYRKLGIAAYEKQKTIKAEVALELDRLENIILLSAEERLEMKKGIEESEIKKKELDQIIAQQLKEKQVKSEILRYQSELANQELAIAQLVRKKEALKGQFKKYDLYEKISPIKGELFRGFDAKESLRKLVAEQNEIQKSLITTESEVQSILAAMGELTGTTVDHNTFIPVMSAFVKEINEMDQELGFILKRGKATRERITGSAEKHRIDLQSRISPDEGIALLRNRLATMEQEINEGGIAINSDPIKERENLSLSQNKLLKLRELHHSYGHSDEHNLRTNEFKKQDALLRTQLENKKPVVASIQVSLKTMEENIQLLQKQKEDALLIAKLSDHRNNLSVGEPCPLCGALHHPYADHEPTTQNDIDNRLITASSKYKELQLKLRQESEGLTRLETLVKRNSVDLATSITELKIARAKEKNLLLQFESTENIKRSNIEIFISKLEAKIVKGSKALDALTLISPIQEVIIDFQSLKITLEEHKILSEKRKSKFTGKDISLVCNDLQNKFATADHQFAKLNSLKETNEKTRIEQEHVVATTSQKVMPILTKLGMKKIEDANELILNESEFSAIKEKKLEIEKHEITLKTQRDSLLKSLEQSNRKETKKEQSLDSLILDLTQNEQLRDHHLKVIAEKSTLLAKDDKAVQRSKNKSNEIQKLNEKLERWDLLNKMIGDAGGNKFANFAQGLTLQNLLVFANKRLRNLSDRYLIDKPIKDGPLTVIDQYQGNIQRSVTTLSGGESFLISLALALSLSDMASKNVRLESLFIDEGFGTLDQETLDIAMNTLEKLQSESQKTVGVISHVEALKDRINVQIKLKKNAQGYSSIVIAS